MKAQTNQTLFWIAWRWFTKSPKSLTFWTALVGLALGVASLTVAMAVMTGFEKTLQGHVVNLTGHIRAYHLVGAPESFEEFESKLKSYPEITHTARFLHSQGLVAKSGKMLGVYLQGVEESNWQHTLKLESRLQEGVLDLSGQKAVIGSVFAEYFGLKVGDHFKLVSPIWNEIDPAQFQRKVVDLEVAGIVDFGKYDYDERWILSSLTTAQLATNSGNRQSGLILNTENVRAAPELARKIFEDLGAYHRVTDWREVAGVLFDAVEHERKYIFMVIFVIVIAAVFSVGSHLYISVIRRQSDLSLLRSLGLSQRNVMLLFGYQGMIVSLGGILLGMSVGVGLCVMLTVLQKHFHILSGKVYSISVIDWSMRPLDLLMIFGATSVLCLIATVLPALRASRFSIAQGVRND